jgi:hypothetical protein
MLQNMLQLAMSSIDEIESQSGPEVYPAIRRTKDYIRETSLLIQANTQPKSIDSENDLIFKNPASVADSRSQGQKDFQVGEAFSGYDFAKIKNELREGTESYLRQRKGEREKTQPERKILTGKDAGIGQLEKVGRLRYIMHLIRKFRRKS